MVWSFERLARVSDSGKAARAEGSCIWRFEATTSEGARWSYYRKFKSHGNVAARRGVGVPWPCRWMPASCARRGSVQ
eukprot:6176313-Pleurochrysis_carterae.AAC.5